MGKKRALLTSTQQSTWAWTNRWVNSHQRTKSSTTHPISTTPYTPMPPFPPPLSFSSAYHISSIKALIQTHTTCEPPITDPPSHVKAATVPGSSLPSAPPTNQAPALSQNTDALFGSRKRQRGEIGTHQRLGKKIDKENAIIIC